MEKANYNDVLVEYTGVSVFKELNSIIADDSGLVLLHTKDTDILMNVLDTAVIVYGYRNDIQWYTTNIVVNKTDDLTITHLIVIIIKSLKNKNMALDL